MTIRLRESVLTPISGRGSSFFSGTVYLLNPYVVSPAPAALPLDPIHPVIISPLIVEATPESLPLNEGSISYYLSFGATESLAITPVTPTLAYLADCLHESYYWTPHFRVHHTSYQSENSSVQVLHEVSWSNSSFTLHELSYRSLVSSFDQIQHNVSWVSLGGATAANHLHEVSWASLGGVDSPSAFHTVTYQSLNLTQAWTQHDISWASLGGATSAFQWNEVSWASLDQSVAFNLHETTWQSLGGASSASAFHTATWEFSPSIRRQHDIQWKSIEAHERFHTTAWNSDTSIHRLHETRYRSNQTTTTLLGGDFYVRI